MPIDPLQFALYGRYGYSIVAPKVKTARPAKAQNALRWRNITRDMSPTRLIVDMPRDETVFGRASGCTVSTDANNARKPTRDSDEFAAWKAAMGIA